MVDNFVQIFKLALHIQMFVSFNTQVFKGIYVVNYTIFNADQVILSKIYTVNVTVSWEQLGFCLLYIYCYFVYVV